MKRAIAALSVLIFSAVAANAAEQGAKGMFYEQLSKPAETINNGLQYWIELKRPGQPLRNVSNKFEFRSGDQIRLHVRSNVDGFAYVVLREGSQGEHAVLFPDPHHADDNHLKANSEYTIPNDSYLAFDQNPGTERVTFVLSRNPIEPKKNNFQDKVIIASRVEGSKDLIPGSLVISYGNSDALPNLVGKPPAVVPSTEPSVKPVEQSHPGVELIPPAHPAEDENAIITVVQKNPADALAMDICLEHKP
jgi:hypothetical protein